MHIKGVSVFYVMFNVILISLFNLGAGQVTEPAGNILQRHKYTNLNAFLRPEVKRTQSNASFKRLGINTDESVMPTRSGSLNFEFDNQGDNPVSALYNLDAKLKRLSPSVQCSHNSMTLKVKRGRAPYFMVDSGEGPSIPFSQMPSHCGYSVRRSRRDVMFVAPYQGCHVTQQSGKYVLPLHLWGSPVTMSCPVAPTPPSVSCFTSGMVLKIAGVAARDIKVKESGRWKPLTSVCRACGFAVDDISGGLKISAPYNKGSCIEIKDDEYLLSLLLDEGEIIVTCPTGPSTSTTATTLSSDTGRLPQYPQYPLYSQFPLVPQYPVIPGPNPQTPPPVWNPDAQLIPHYPIFERKLHTDKYPQVPNLQHYLSLLQNHELPPMPQFPPEYPMLPGYQYPTQPQATSSTKNTDSPPVNFNLPQVPPFLFYPEYPMVHGFQHPTPRPPTTLDKATENEDVQYPLHQEMQFPMFPPYAFHLVNPGNFPEAPAIPTVDPEIQGPQPYPVYPQVYQVPVLQPPPQYFQSQNIPVNFNVAAPTATFTPPPTTATTHQSDKGPFHYPYPYMPMYYIPQQAQVPFFPVPFGTTEPLSSDLSNQLNVYNSEFNPYPQIKM